MDGYGGREGRREGEEVREREVDERMRERGGRRKGRREMWVEDDQRIETGKENRKGKVKEMGEVIIYKCKGLR